MVDVGFDDGDGVGADVLISVAFVVVDVGVDDGDGAGADVLIAYNRRSSARASQSEPELEPSKEEG